MLDHIRQRQELIAKSITGSYVNTDSIIKGGPGSGRTVGTTKSGKILTTKDFSQEALHHAMMSVYHHDDIQKRQKHSKQLEAEHKNNEESDLLVEHYHNNKSQVKHYRDNSSNGPQSYSDVMREKNRMKIGEGGSD